jgi:FixJ family two-component response regulator
MGVEILPSLDALATKADLDVIIEVTGREDVRATLQELKPPSVDFIDSAAARFFIQRIQNSSNRSLDTANNVRLRFDEIGASLA